MTDDEDFNFAKAGVAQRAILQLIEDALIAAGEDEKVWATVHGSFIWRTSKRMREKELESSNAST